VAPPKSSYASRRLRRTVADWAALASGLAATATAGLPAVIWADQNLPRPALPYISLRRLSSISDSEQTRIEADVSLTSLVQVTTTTEDEAARISLVSGWPGYIVQAGDAIEDVRDGLIAEILSRSDAVTCEVTADDAFEIAGLGPGLAWPISALEGTVVTSVDVADVEITADTRTATIRVELFAFDTPDARADDYADSMVGQLKEFASFFAERSCSVVGLRPRVQDISATSGAERETRAYFDLQIAQWTRRTAADPAALDSISDPSYLAQPPAGDLADIELRRATVAA
jgi:hypothetical protein